MLGFSIGSALAQDIDPDLGDHPDFSHAMGVETRLVDGVPAVFQYGEVRPDFEATTGNSWRTRFSLDGEWEFRFTDEESALLVTVPHNWEAMTESRFWGREETSSANPATFDGAAYYRRTFSHQPQDGQRYRLEFRGVRERARVWLNGHEVAQHEGLGAPFSIDVTKALQAGENELKVKVLRLAHYRQDEEGKSQEIEGVHTPYPKAPDYWPYAGLSGSVALWGESTVSIRKLQVRTKGDKLQVHAFVSHSGSAAFEGRLILTSGVLASSSPSQEVTLLPGAVAALQFEIPLKKEAQRWSPQTPQLYDLTARLLDEEQVVDGCRIRLGLREFAVAGEGLALNGAPVFLKGVAAYSETAHGVALTREENAAIFQRALDAGANFVRLPVRQCDLKVYQLADEMGLMVTGEWGGFWYKEQSMAAQTMDPHSVYQTMGRVAVWDLMNRPSVVLWCTNNECHQFCPEYEPFVKMNHTLVHEIDGGMLPVTWAAWHPHQGQPHFEWADVVGFNEYRGAMDPFERLQPDMVKVRAQNPGKPIVILENGSWAKLGKRGRRDQRGTEDWQADLLRRQWQVLQNHTPPLSGYVFWTLQDYRSRKPYTGNRRANGWSGMGLYTPEGEAKLARDVFRGIDFSAPTTGESSEPE